MVTNLCFCGWCVDWFREFIRFSESLRQCDAAYGTILLITCPAASGDITTYDTLDREHIELAAHHGLAFIFLLLEKLRHILCINRDHVVWKDIFCQIEPEFGHLGQNSSFLCNFIVQDDIEATDTVSCNHDQTVPIVIDLSYFTFFDWF